MTVAADQSRGVARASRATCAAFSRSRARRAWSSSLGGEPKRGATVRRSSSYVPATIGMRSESDWVRPSA